MQKEVEELHRAKEKLMEDKAQEIEFMKNAHEELKTKNEKDIMEL